MAPSPLSPTSRRGLLGRLPVALLGLAAAALPAPRPAAAKPRAGSAPYDPARQTWRCTYNECDPYYYMPSHGDPENIMGDHPIPAGTTFEDLPDDWRCPICGAGKIWFVKDRVA
ncbi:rubredoxin [Roseospira visakhapatnamensis]|uniref:Rubredoxin n=1 Tax=Roseospira visakhapatnamensis TaxID=390880 RepID=A0A7W6RC87_9PROT|nr:rubredoxin [Roseospira visakhapatnamensis]MBB4265486.1 rubredoxin [Roseospira visakhapatnamensis]